MLREFFTENLDIVFFVYGLAFFTMGMIIFAQPRRVHSDTVFGLSRIIWIFAGFGVIRGIIQWFYMITTTRGYTSNTLDLIWVGGLTLSYVFLFEFGRRLILLSRKKFLNKWVTIVLFLLTIALIVILNKERTVWSRYLLGFPSGIMTALGLVFYYRSNEAVLQPLGVRRYFLIAAISIGIWAVFSGGIPPKGDFFPPSVVNEASFLNLVGIPVWVFRAICAVLLTWSVWNILSIFDWELKAKLKNSEKLAAMGKVASLIGHEFRNQLGTMGISVYFLKTKLQEADEKVKKHLMILEHEVMETNRTIENILAYSRTGELERKSLDLGNVLLAAIDKIPNPNKIAVVTQIDKDLPQVWGDEIRLSQVFVNVIINALQAIGEKEGRLTIRAGRMHNFVEVLFEDTGPGIKQEDKEKLFTPFFSTKSRGVGLGLALCKNITEMHNGSIDVKSEVGKGTVVTVRLPIRG